MKREHDDLEEQLRDLPKHSLNQKDKRKVIQSIRSAPKPTRLSFLKPLSIGVIAACLLMIAYLASPMYSSILKKETELGLSSVTEQDNLKSMEITNVTASEKSMDTSGEKLRGIRIEVSLASKELVPMEVWNNIEFRADNPYLFSKDSYGKGKKVSYNTTANEAGYNYTIAFESMYANYSQKELENLFDEIENIRFTVEYNGTLFTLENRSQEAVTLDAPLATTFPLSDGNQHVIGIEGKIGILGPEHFVAEDQRRGAKLMLNYWGESDSLVGKEYRVEAVHGDGETLQLSKGVLAAALYSEDAHVVTSFPAFTREGFWQLSFYVEDNLFEQFRIEVLPPFPKTEHYTMLDAPKEIPIGESVDIVIESTIREKNDIEVLLVSSDEEEILQKSSFQYDGYPLINAKNGQRLFHYDGQITFPKKGAWKLMINGEETQVFEN